MRLSFTSIAPAFKPCLKHFNNIFLGCQTHAATSHCPGRPQLKQRQAHPSPVRWHPHLTDLQWFWDGILCLGLAHACALTHGHLPTISPPILLKGPFAPDTPDDSLFSGCARIHQSPMLLGQMISFKDPMAFHLANSYLSFNYHYEWPLSGCGGGLLHMSYPRKLSVALSVFPQHI